MIKTELLSAGEVAALLSGDANVNTIATLRSGQRSRNLLLLRSVLDLVDESAAHDGAIARLPENFNALCAVEAAAPRQVADQLAGPHFGAWVAFCLRRLIGREPVLTQPLWIDLAHLGSLVISLAVAVAVEAEAAVPVCSGRIVIPGIGCVLMEDETDWGMATIQRYGDGTLAVRRTGTTLTIPCDPPADSSSWRGIRKLRGSCEGLDIEVELDDLDPYRDRFGLRTPAAGRLADNEAEQWQDQFARAWSILAERHRDHAVATGTVLRTVIPLAARETGDGVSATLRYASGAISLTPQPDGVRLARTMVHELHHMKLNLIMDWMPLFRMGHAEWFYSPWRDDPRPLVGLLHGLYAGVAVSDFWRAECDGPQGGTLAEFELARIRGQVELGLPVLTRSKQLTSAGISVIAAISATVASWQSGPIEGYPAILADDMVADHLIRWRLHNLMTQDHDITPLAAAWSDGAAPPRVPDPTLAPGQHDSFAENARLRLAYRALTDGMSPVREMSKTSASQADLYLISGDYAAAAAAYQAEIGTGNESSETWAGLAVSRRRLVGGGNDAMVMRPELVRALHGRLGADSARAPSPLDIADWLTPACQDGQEQGQGEPGGIHLPVTLKVPQNRILPGGHVQH